MMTWVQELPELPTTVIVALKMTVLLGAGWVLHVALVRRNPRWRVLVWRGVMAGMVLLPVGELLLPKLQVPVAPPLPVEESVRPPTADVPPAPIAPDAYVAPVAAAALPVDTPERLSILVWTKDHLSLLLLTGWGLIGLILAVRLFFTIHRVRQVVKASKPAPERIRRAMEKVAADLQCRARVNLRVTADLRSPFLVGVIRPILVLPERMMDEHHAGELPAVFAHELAHVRTHDLIWILVGKWLSVLLWFHPLVWTVRAAHVTACEQVCDAVAAEYVGGSPTYSQTLARAALELVVDAPALAGIPMIRSADITRRLRNLKRGIKAAALARPWVAGVVAVGCVTLMGLGCLKFVCSERVETDEPRSASEEALEARRYTFGPVIERWVNDDDAGEDFGIDFDTGLLGDPSPKNGKGVDGMVDVSGKPKNIICFDMVVLAADHVWDGDPEAVVKRLQGGKPGSPIYMSAEGELPKSFIFKTYEGGMGVLQILELSDRIEPRGLRVRYKLVREEDTTKEQTDAAVRKETPAAVEKQTPVPLPERVVTFPETHSVGTLMVGDWGSPENWEPLGEARGRVTVPAGKELRLTTAMSTYVNSASFLADLDPLSLQWLYVVGELINMRDEDLALLARFELLNTLTLQQVPDITDAGVEHLTRIPSLRRLHLFDVDIGDEGLAHIAKLTALEELALTHTNITDAGLENLKGLSTLRGLHLNHNQISDAGLICLKSLTKIETLALRGTQVSDAGLQHLRPLTSLKFLDLSKTQVTDAGMEHLKQLPSLSHLLLSETAITAAAMKHLKQLPSLSQLILDGTKTTDAGVEDLQEMSRLEMLDLWGTQISSDALEKLRKLLPNCRIIAGRASGSDRGVSEGRVVHFPADRSLGRLMVRDEGAYVHWNEGWEPLGDARGTVHVPVGKQLRLEVSREAAKDLSPLANLKPDDLYYVMLWRTQARDDALKHLAHLTGLQVLDARYTLVTDDGLKHLNALTSLKILRLGGTQIGDAALANIKGMTSLESLNIGPTLITDEGMAHIAHLRSLRTLNLHNNADVSDAGLAHLKDLTSLKWLSLCGTRISYRGLAHLSKLTKMEHLNLSDTDITDRGLAHLSRMRSLKYLRMDGTRVGDRGLVHLKNLKALETLYLPGNRISDKGLAQLAELPALKKLPNDLMFTSIIITADYLPGLAHLKKLHLGTAEKVTDAGLAHLAKIRSLEELNIGGSNITDAGVVHLAQLTGLKTLWLQNSEVTDAGLATLRSLKLLEELLLNRTKVTGAGLAHLKGFPSLNRLHLSDTELGEDGLKHLADLTGLEWLSFGHRVSDDDMVHLVNLKQLKHLEIHEGRVSDGGFAHLAGLTALERITAWGCDLTDESLAHLSNKDSLEYLQITGDFTDAGLRHLEGLPSLRYLEISGNFSDEARARLQQKTPSLQELNVVEARE